MDGTVHVLAIGTHKKLETETSTEIFSLPGVEDLGILRQRSTGSLRRGSHVLHPQELSADLYFQV